MSDPGQLRTPLEDVHLALGARMAPFAGWRMPIEYAGTLSEHRAVRERAGLFDLSHLGKVDVAGPRALGLLQRLLTNDVSRVEPGRAQYNLVLNEAGGVREDLIAYRLSPERWFVVPNASNTAMVVDLLRSAGEADVESHDDWCFLGVQGPRSVEVMGALFPQAADLAFLGVTEVEHAGRRVVLTRSGYTGEIGFELFTTDELAHELWNALADAGEPFAIEPCGLGARDVLRLEMGYPLYGQDLMPERTPLEAGLGWAVALDGDDFTGRAALMRQREEGLPSRLRGLVTEDRRSIPRPHQPVLDGDRIAGEVTSGTFSPTLQRGIAMAYLSPASSFEPGAEAAIDIRGRRASATVVRTPFVERTPRG